MRNITLSNFESFRVTTGSSVDCFYTDRDCVLLYSEGRVLRYQTDKKSLTEIYNVIQELCPTYDNGDKARALDLGYSSGKDIIIILSNGAAVCLNIQEDNTYSGRIADYTEGGLKAAKWSPDGSYIALVSGRDKVILMTHTYNELYKTHLHAEEFKQEKVINETPYQGSEEKSKAQVNSAATNQNALNTMEPLDNSVRISWRGDGEYFVVSSLNPETRERYLRIFNYEGILQYTSESAFGLEHSLDWKPSGNLIACTQKLPNKYNVCFFEKNGLKHGDFTLPFRHEEFAVKELMWNKDSKLLAVLIEKTDNINPVLDNGIYKNVGEKMILIYCVSNHHWYCKYSIPFPSDNEIKMQWDQLTSNLLHVILTKDNHIFYNKYTWFLSVQKSRGKSSTDRALVAVIDGSKLLITSFKSSILPPPMYTYSLEMECQINQVGFAPDSLCNSPNDLFVQLCNGEIYIYQFECNDKKPNEITYKLIQKLYSKNEFNYNIHWVSPRTLACCATVCDPDSKFFLKAIDIYNSDSPISVSEKNYRISSSIALLNSCSESCIVFHDNAGITYLFDKDEDLITELYQKRQLRQLQVMQISEKSFITFGLDESNKFYINDKMLANNITSFHIHQQFLLLTNLKHTLLCIPIEADVEKMIAKFDANEISTRRVEKGSRIITSVPEDTKVILQMPRGNLECIQPRALSLSIIGKYLDELQFYDAFSVMRQQRINLNLLFDHNPTLFKENVYLFVNQIKDPSWISIFLSELVDEDVTKSMYSAMYKNRETENTTEKSKVSMVCELLENALENVKDSDRYILPVLTTFVKRSETRYIECALSKIKKLRECEKSGQKPAVTTDDAFRYLCCLIDVEDLYRVALGMYDFDLALFVATKSQMDPKEYLSFLNHLRKLEINYQKFVIDKHLKRYEKALKHLLQCAGDDFFTECLTFIKTHKLYKAALKLVPHTTDRYKQICANYADELMKLYLYEEAGIMYSNSGSYSNAISAYMKSGNWQEVISCSTKLNFTSRELYTNLAVELLERKKFRESAIVFMDYLQNTERALMALCSGKMFAEAFRIAELHNRDDLVQAHIKPSILKCYENTKIQFSSFGELFDTQKKRLGVVREKKLQQKEDGCELNSEEDDYSESSTVVTQSYAGSRTTNRTFRSAKNKRKQERKLLSLKEGSPYEDLALIASLHNIVSNFLNMNEEVKELNKSLIKINEVCLAEEMQKSYEILLNKIEISKTEIWTPDLLTRRQIYGPEATSNSIAASFMGGKNSTPTNLINPRLLIPPEAQTNAKWQLEMLNP